MKFKKEKDPYEQMIKDTHDYEKEIHNLKIEKTIVWVILAIALLVLGNLNI